MRKFMLLITVTAALTIHVNAQNDSSYYEKGKFGFLFTPPSLYIGGGYSSLSLNIRPEFFIEKKLSLGVEI